MGVLSGGPKGCQAKGSVYGNFRDFYGQIRRYLGETTAPIPVPPIEPATIVDDHGNTRDTATFVGIPSDPGEEATWTVGEIAPVGDSDWFRLEVPRAGSLTVWTRGETDTVGTLYGPGGEIGRNDDGGGAGNFHIVADVQPGTHYVEVRGFDDSKVGIYVLRVKFSHLDDHGGTPDTATNVGIPSDTRGKIEPLGDSDWFRLEVPRPGRLTVQTTGSTNTFGILSMPVPGGDDKSWSSWWSGDGYNFRIDADVQPGVHYVEVRGGADSAIGDYQPVGDYLLRIELSPFPVLTLPFLTPASNTAQQGFIRIANLTNPARGGTVSINAIDDSGRRFGPVTLSLDAGQTRHISSQDLEHGNPSMGLSGGVGHGEGNWWLEFHTDLHIEPRAYIRTQDGFLTSIHLAAEGTPVSEFIEWDYSIPIFNPGSNLSKRSVLRLVNSFGGRVGVTIHAWDDRNHPQPGERVALWLNAGTARMLTAQELEQGGTNLYGSLGDGRGKWRLAVVSRGHPIQVMSLLYTESGHISNLTR